MDEARAAEWKRLILTGAAVSFASEVPAEEKTFPSAWLAEASATKARIELRGAILAGALELCQVEFSESVQIESCIFLDAIGFPRCTFAKNASFRQCTFQGAANFSSATLRGNADFSDASFSATGANFSDVHVQGVFTGVKMKFATGAKADFQRARCEASLVAGRSEFGGEANFVGAEIKGHAGLNGCAFRGRARFNSTAIGGNAVFHADPETGAGAAGFGDEAEFLACSIGGTLCLDGVAFAGEGKPVSFNIARVGKNVLLRGCRFAGPVNFVGAHIGELATVQGSIFQQAATFAEAHVAGSFYLAENKENHVACAVFQGPANFWGIRVDGSADFSGVQFQAKDELVQFGNAQFGSVVNFNESSFQGSMALAGARIAGDAYFQNAHFGCVPAGQTTAEGGAAAAADFSMTRFGGSVIFTGAAFQGANLRANFTGAHIAGNATFFGCRFEGPADFTIAEFGGAAAFQGARFLGTASFNTAFVRGLGNFRAAPELNLKAASFAGDANFVGATFGDTADFSEVQFLARDHVAQFANAKFQSLANFIGVAFLGSANLAGARITGDALFQNAHFGSTSAGGNDTKTEGMEQLADFSMARFGGSLNLATAVFEGAALRANFVGVHIAGNGIFSGCCFEGPADFTTAEICGAGSFQGARFQKAASFHTTMVRGLANFRPWPEKKLGAASFADEANFVGVTFCETADFTSVEFQCARSALLLDSARFSHNAIFSGASFAGPATFIGTSFEGSTYFQWARFAPGAAASFRGARFAAGGYFQFAQFGGPARFEMASYGMEASFSGAEFLGEAKFNGSQFSGIAHFDAVSGETSSTLGPIFREFSCDQARFERDAHFEGAHFTKPASFREASFRSLHFRGGEESAASARFEDAIDFRGCTYERIEVRWEDLLLREEQSSAALPANHFLRLLPAPLQRRLRPPAIRQTPYDRQPYAQLEARLRSAGLEGIADDVYLERCRVERGQASFRGHPTRWLGRHAYKWVANCGVQPIRVAVFALLLIAGGTVLFSQPGAVGPAAEAKTPQTGQPTAPRPVPHLSRAEAFGVSFHQFLPVDVPLGGQWSPAERAINIPLRIGAWHSSCRVIPTVYSTFFLRLAGWILVPLGVAALTGILRHRGDT